MARYSRSAVETYSQCPRKYAARYIQRLPDSEGPGARIGTCLHKVVERYAEALYSSKQRSDKGTFWRVANEELAALPAQEAIEAREVAQKFVDSYVMLLDYVHGLEVELSVKLPSGDELFGRLDRLDVVLGERAIIHDYKSGRSIPTDAEVGAAFQNLFYAFLVHKNFPEVGEIAAAQLFIRYGVIRDAVLDRDAIDFMGQLAQDVVGKLQADKDWKPRPGSWCSYCPSLKGCVEDSVIEELASTEELVKWHCWAESMLKRVEPQLRDLAEKEPIAYDDKHQLGFWTRESASYETQAVMVACTGLGLNLADYLQPKGAAVKKLAKRMDEWGRIVRESKILKTSTVFGKKAVAPESIKEEEPE